MKDYAREIFAEVNMQIIPYSTDIYIKGEELIIIPKSDYNAILAELKKKYTEGKMIENNFTDEQVIKALECCEKGGACTSCPLKDDYSPCSSSMAHLAFSLINKQKTDFDLLKSTITHKEEEAYNKGYEDAKKSILMDIKAIMQIIILDYKEIGAFDNAEIVGYVRDHLIAELEKRYTEGVKKE
jgi:hypothetical protein